MHMATRPVSPTLSFSSHTAASLTLLPCLNSEGRVASHEWTERRFYSVMKRRDEFNAGMRRHLQGVDAEL